MNRVSIFIAAIRRSIVVAGRVQSVYQIEVDGIDPRSTFLVSPEVPGFSYFSGTRILGWNWLRRRVVENHVVVRVDRHLVLTELGRHCPVLRFAICKSRRVRTPPVTFCPPPSTVVMKVTVPLDTGLPLEVALALSPSPFLALLIPIRAEARP